MKYEKLGTTDISVSKICYCRRIAQAVHLNEHQQIQQSILRHIPVRFRISKILKPL